jgi:hypothetical protein
MSAEADRAVINDYLVIAMAFRKAVRRPEEGDGGQGLMMQLLGQHTAVADAAARLGAFRPTVAGYLRHVEKCAEAVWRAVTYEWRVDGPGAWQTDGLLNAITKMEQAERPIFDLLPGPAGGGGATGDGVVRFSEDYHSMRWGAEVFTFTHTQAACVRVWAEARKNGTPDVGDLTVLERSGSSMAAGGGSSRLRDLFKNHPAWDRAIVSRGKGSRRLADPPH